MPLPTGLVVKNGSKMRSRISAGMPGPLSTTRTTTRCRSRLRGHLDAAGLGHRIERVVDQVRPDLVELADEAADARQAGLHVARRRSIDFVRAFDLSTATVLPRLDVEVHRLGHRRLVHVRESLDRRDQAGDAHRGFLNLRGDPAHRASGRRPAEDRVERGAAHRAGDPIERVERHGGFGQRPGDGGVDAVSRRASRRWRPRVRPAGSATARPWSRSARQDARTASMAASCASVSLEAPSARVACSASSRRSSSSAALAFDGRRRVVQLVGQPGGQLAERDHLLVVQAARREDPGAIEHLVHEDRRDLVAVANHRRAGRRAGSPGSRTAPARRSRPEALTSREYGSTPVTSPARHSITLCRPAPRSTKMATCPVSMTNRPSTGTPFAVTTSPSFEMPKRPVRGQPLELLARRRAEGLVLGEPIDEIR